MNLDFTAVSVGFYSQSALAGRYHYQDEYKPHFHPLNTPCGHTVSLASPHDHKHHKGLMYALRTETCNFWEETPTTSHENVGIQRHLRFDQVIGSGEQVGFQEMLEWQDSISGQIIITESRDIRCRMLPERNAFLWQWSTWLVAQQNCTLIQSQWSHVAPNGRKTNYHGLGLRFCREFGGGTGNNQVVVNGEVHLFTDAMGMIPEQVAYIGSFDGCWPPAKGYVEFRQTQKNGLFVYSDPFAFLSLGPSNISPFEWQAGNAIEEQYSILISDFGNQSEFNSHQAN